MSAARGTRSRRAGLSLVEVTIVTALVGVIAAYVGGVMLASSRLGRDAYVDNEVASLAERAVDQLAAVLGPAARITAVSNTSVTVQHEWDDDMDGVVEATDTDGTLEQGLRMSANRYIVNGSLQVNWVDLNIDLSESGVGLDLNEDGDTSDLVDCGALEIVYLSAASTAIVRTRIGSQLNLKGRVFVLNPTFSRPETGTPGVDDDLDGLVDETTTNQIRLFSTVGGSTILPTVATAKNLQLNFVVVHAPVPGPDGKPQLYRARVTRALSFRGGAA